MCHRRRRSFKEEVEPDVPVKVKALAEAEYVTEAQSGVLGVAHGGARGFVQGGMSPLVDPDAETQDGGHAVADGDAETQDGDYAGDRAVADGMSPAVRPDVEALLDQVEELMDHIASLLDQAEALVHQLTSVRGAEEVFVARSRTPAGSGFASMMKYLKKLEETGRR